MALVSGEELEMDTVELPCSALTWDAGTMVPPSDLDLASLESDGHSFRFAIAQLAGQCTNSPTLQGLNPFSFHFTQSNLNTTTLQWSRRSLQSNSLIDGLVQMVYAELHVNCLNVLMKRTCTLQGTALCHR